MPAEETHPVSKNGRGIWIVLILLCLIAIAATVRRGVALLYPPKTHPTVELAHLDARFAAQRALTFAHIIPAFVFAVLVPFQFVSGIRTRHPALHRWNGRILISVGTLAGLTGLLLVLHPVGGAVEVAAILTFDAIFLTSLWNAYRFARQRNFVQHREWILRAVAVALGVATVRPVMGVFFATSRITHLTPHDFFGWAFWTGFSLNVIAMEIWIRRTRASGKTSPVAGLQAKQAAT